LLSISSGHRQARSLGGAMGAISTPQSRKLRQKFSG